MHVIVPDRVLEEIDEVRLDERVLGKLARRAIVEEILPERIASLEIAEIGFADVAFQGTPMNEFRKRDG